jgi:hypothetical protein
MAVPGHKAVDPVGERQPANSDQREQQANAPEYRPRPLLSAYRATRGLETVTRMA